MARQEGESGKRRRRTSTGKAASSRGVRKSSAGSGTPRSRSGPASHKSTKRKTAATPSGKRETTRKRSGRKSSGRVVEQRSMPAAEVVAGNEWIQDEIRRRAYEIYLARTPRDGDALSDWLQAERDVRGKAESIRP